jgi:GNAT superfamily N-acetyltransferase
MGGLLFSIRPTGYEIGWLAVAERWRRRGVGAALVTHACSLVVPPADLRVTTFGSDVQGGRAARRFYRKMGFAPFAAASDGPDGGSREVFRRTFG